MNLLSEIGTMLFDKAAEKPPFPLIQKTTEHYRRGDGTQLKIDPNDLKEKNIIKNAVTKKPKSIIEFFIIQQHIIQKTT